jgi:hypothetical protein
MLVENMRWVFSFFIQSGRLFHPKGVIPIIVTQSNLLHRTVGKKKIIIIIK